MCNLIKNYKTLTIKKNKPKQVFVVLIKSKVQYLLIVITTFNTGRHLNILCSNDKWPMPGNQVPRHLYFMKY